MLSVLEGGIYTMGQGAVPVLMSLVYGDGVGLSRRQRETCRQGSPTKTGGGRSSDRRSDRWDGCSDVDRVPRFVSVPDV